MKNRDKGIGRVNCNKKIFLLNHQKAELSEQREARATRYLTGKSTLHSWPTESPGRRQRSQARQLECVMHSEVCSVCKTLRSEHLTCGCCGRILNSYGGLQLLFCYTLSPALASALLSWKKLSSIARDFLFKGGTKATAPQHNAMATLTGWLRRRSHTWTY